jgi:hypothetical protein
MDRCHFGCIQHRDGAGITPPPQHWRDREPAGRDIEVGQHGEHFNTSRVQARLLLSFTQRRGDGVGVLRVDTAPGERRLPGVGAHIVGPFDEKHIGAFRGFTEEH